MAVSSTSRKVELPSELSVQELVKTTPKQVPERYISQLRNQSGDDQSEITYMDNSVIDLSLLSSSPSHQREELDKLRSVLSSWGCLQVCYKHFNLIKLQQSFCS